MNEPAWISRTYWRLTQLYGFGTCHIAGPRRFFFFGHAREGSALVAHAVGWAISALDRILHKKLGMHVALVGPGCLGPMRQILARL